MHAAAPVAAGGVAMPDPADVEDDEDEAVAAGQGQPAVAGENGDRKRRRRRRRRRGGRGADGQAVAGESQQPAVPDRHIFRVDPEGAAHATGET